MKKGRALPIALAVLTLLLCAALCTAVLTLYVSGVNRRAASQSAMAPIFTREAVGRWALGIAPLFFLWLITAIVAILTGVKGGQLRGRGRVAAPRAPVPPMGQPETAPRRLLRGGLLVLAAALIAAGALNGGLRDVLVKAIHICTECIGLG